jgi:hypothetical protein
MDDIQQEVSTMLNSILRKAGKYLIGLSDRKPANEAPRGPDQGRQFSDQARRISSSRGQNDRKLLAGSIRFLDLDEIKRELGVNWGRASAAASASIPRGRRLSGSLGQARKAIRAMAGQRAMQN